MAKVYVVFSGYSYDTFEGTWNGGESIDSIWKYEEDAKRRLDDLYNEYVAKEWYEEGLYPGEDYKVEWVSEDKSCIKLARDSYEETCFRYEAHELRTGWVEDNKDLPAYFTTT